MLTAVPVTDLNPRDFAARMTRRAGGVPIARALRRGHKGRRLAVLSAAIALPAMAAPADWQTSAPAEAPVLTASDAGTSFAQTVRLAPAALASALREGFIAPAGEAAPLAAGPAAGSLLVASNGRDIARAQQCMTMAIYYEAATESEAGQRAVAQVVLNRVAHRDYPDSVCGVVFQGSTRQTGCQFSFTCDGSLARKPDPRAWQRATRVARAALAGSIYAPVGLATHYHTVDINPYWADDLDVVGTIGLHRFYRKRGAPGQLAAYRYRYLGGEPLVAAWPGMPIPERSIVPVQTPAVPTAFARIADGSAGPGDAEAAQQAAIQLPAGEAAEEQIALPQAGRVRPEFARSGQWRSQPQDGAPAS